MTINNILCILIFIVSYFGFTNRELFFKFMHLPYEEKHKGQYYRWLTSAFLHRDWTHLLINLMVLYSFGDFVEIVFQSFMPGAMGRVMYVCLFVVCVLVANLPSYLKHRDNHQYSAIGASGGTSGVLFAAILFSPWDKILLFLVIPIWSIVFGVLYIAYEIYASKSLDDNVGHDAHIWGAIAGILFTLISFPQSWNIFLHQLIQNFPF